MNRPIYEIKIDKNNKIKEPIADKKKIDSLINDLNKFLFEK